MAMDDLPETIKVHHVSLSKQSAEKRRKEELVKYHLLEKSMEIHIDALYYYDMYNSSAYRRTCNDVDNGMRSLKNISPQDYPLKENIRMCVTGFGWTEFAHE